MSTEALLAAGYAGALTFAAFGLEWLSAHTHRRALRFRTLGFSYDADLDRWDCPEGQHLWPHEFDHERRLVRYRAKAHICNGCHRKEACTDSDEGREVVRPLDPWPHSEAGRFHRVISLMLIGVAALVLVVSLARNHAPAEMTLLAGMLALCAAAARRLLRDLVQHPANAPEPTVATGLRMVAAGADGSAPRSRWASQNRIGA